MKTIKIGDIVIDGGSVTPQIILHTVKVIIEDMACIMCHINNLVRWLPVDNIVLATGEQIIEGNKNHKELEERLEKQRKLFI